jgi:hypothetical protein
MYFILLINNLYLNAGGIMGRQTKKPSRIWEGFNILIVYDHLLLSGNGFASPFPIKTIQVLAITALIAELAFIPVLYVVVKIMILIVRIIVMQSYIIISKQQIPGPKREWICLT